MKTLKLIHNEDLKLPAFFPDGTYGVVKSVDSADIMIAHINGVVMNAMHLSLKPGVNLIRNFSGINNFAGLNTPVLTDSGGFQVYSLIRENKKYGQIRNNEIIFYPALDDEKFIYTPEKCIQNQFAYRSDIMMCLDYCTHPNDPIDIQKKSVDTTIKWAKLCKKEYEIQFKNYKYSADKRPLIFAIIQGGTDKDLREYCAQSLQEIGFDGFGFGGWPLNDKGELLEDILEYTATLMPDSSIKYAMGIGKPEEIVKCTSMGYDLFDCVIPTREARHHRLYVYVNDNVFTDGFYKYVYIMDDKYAADSSPVSEDCDCYCCRNYSKAYLRHLYKLGDPLSLRLGTIHNLRFYSSLMERIRSKK